MHEEYYEDGVTRETEIKGDYAIERFITPLGDIQMIRRWNPMSFSWDISKRMIESINDLKILNYAVERRRFRPKYENWQHIEEMGDDIGLGFQSLGYTGLGLLISCYMGVEDTIFAIYDEPDLVGQYIDSYNKKHLELVDIYCQSPAPHMIFGDNLSSDVQSPKIFKKYSLQHYKNIVERFHMAGKIVSSHLDGRLSGIIGIVADAGIDVADACTPAPTGDLIPMEIRKQAGDN